MYSSLQPINPPITRVHAALSGLHSAGRRPPVGGIPYLSGLRRFAKNLNIQLTTPGPIRDLWGTTKLNQAGGEQFFTKRLRTFDKNLYINLGSVENSI